MTLLPAYVRLIRPHQWIKNGFVFLGVVFGQGWEDPTLIAGAIGLFAAFCLVSSAIYVVNDIADRDADRLHPAKRDRPLARGEIGVGPALALGAALAIAGLALAAAVSPVAAGTAVAYIALNLAYSAGLKRIAILDVFMISAGFMLRILAGTVGLGIEPSRWLLLCGLMLTLFLGFCKRRAELVGLSSGPDADESTGQRIALDGYSRSMLDLLITVSVAGAAIGYALYTVDPATIALHRTDRLIFTLPFVLYGLFRYVKIVYSDGGGGDPARDMLRDLHLAVATVGWLAATGWFLSGQ